MKQIFILICSVIFLVCIFSAKSFNTIDDKSLIKVMFYNVENLFDVYNDPNTDDDEFTPEGVRNWNYKKYYKKLFNISKVIIAAGRWQAPDLIGLCEVENRRVLQDLIYETPLKDRGYSIIHDDCTDRRGIDVALLYFPDKLRLLKYCYVSIDFEDTLYRSRDILYALFETCAADSLHVFVNHWPSKYGGVLRTAPRRMDASKTLRRAVDSLFTNIKKPNILIMGDLNDGPESESLSYLLGSNADDEKILFPLIGSSSNPEGTIKYRENWLIYDHLVVSTSLFDSLSNLFVRNGSAGVFGVDFLLETDRKFPGEKTYRTFTGYKYNGGFSDHLPVVMQLYCGGTKNEQP